MKSFDRYRRFFGIALTVLLCLFPFSSIAQKIQPSFACDYSNIALASALTDLERTYALKFMYRPEDIDSVFITYKTQNVDKEQFLDGLSKASGITFFDHYSGRIILFRNFSLVRQFPDNFFEGSPSGDTTSVQIQSAIPFETKGYGFLETGGKQDIEQQVIEVGDITRRFQGENATISGYVTDASTGTPVVGASVFVKNPVKGVFTDQFGYYSIVLPKMEQEVFFSSVGMIESKRRVILYGDGKINIELQAEVVKMKEVVVFGERNSVDNLKTGTVKLDISTIKAIPAILGEPDVMKITLSLPGVQSVGEGAAGFNVRGGATDQNLILINDAVVYNPNHLFGFFSAFNPDVISSAELYKSGIQANYGGRISSVLDVGLRDGNRKKFSVSGGISPVTGKLTFEGPINEKISYLVGLRSTYSDWLFNVLEDASLQNSSASFGDAVVKVNFEPDQKNKLTFSAYHSRDKSRLNTDSTNRYFNNVVSLQWRHQYNSRLFGLISGSYSGYKFNIDFDPFPENAFDLDYSIDNTTLKADFGYTLGARHNLKFGINNIYYQLAPGEISPKSPSSIVNPRKLNAEQGVESAIYFGDEFEYSPRLSLYAGLRISGFALLGPGDVLNYEDGLQREIRTITDTTSFGTAAIIKSYWGPEYRFSMRYKITNDLSFKLSLDRTRQYIHQLTNTTAILPTDTWRLSNTYIRPQVGTQYSGGLYKLFDNTGFEISIEGYFKNIDNVLEYKDGADLVLNEALETDVINAQGRSYGAELLIRKNKGIFTGWLSYTYSRSFVRDTRETGRDIINNSDFYPANFDKPHNLSVITNYKINRRVSLSSNFTYSTGRPVTFPATKYELNGNVYAYFSERNQFRIPDNIRLDFGINLEGNHKVNKLAHGSWSLSVYNLLGRKNAFSVFSSTADGELKVFQLSIFGNPIPTITYNFQF